MSAALVQNGQIVWERGFGFQNQESRIRATPDTPYPIADISQTFASVLVLQCAEQRRLRIDDLLGGTAGQCPSRQRMSARCSATRQQARLPEASTTIRSATRSSRQSSNRAFHSPYRKSVAVNVLERLAMRDGAGTRPR